MGINLKTEHTNKAPLDSNLVPKIQARLQTTDYNKVPLTIK